MVPGTTRMSIDERLLRARGPRPDRLPAACAAARRTTRQAWIFVPPTLSERTEHAPTAIIQGPSGLPEGTFLDDLHRLGVPSRVLHLGDAAVVVCARSVSLRAVGL